MRPSMLLNACSWVRPRPTSRTTRPNSAAMGWGSSAATTSIDCSMLYPERRELTSNRSASDNWSLKALTRVAWRRLRYTRG